MTLNRLRRVRLHSRRAGINDVLRRRLRIPRLREKSEVKEKSMLSLMEKTDKVVKRDII